ncbi:hypothetical protein WJX84_003114, partial [Apatococcus fuscideae]
MAPIMEVVEIIRSTSPASKTYLTCSDLIVRQYCPGVIVGFSYEINASMLKAALNTVVDQHYRILTGRLQQDTEDHLYVDDSNSGFPFSVSKDNEASLSSILPTLSRPLAQEIQPVTTTGGPFLPQLDLVAYLAGKGPLCALQLTNVQDGSILGLSISHVLTDAEGFGQLFYDLSRAYQGLSVSPKAPSRFAMQQLASQAAGSTARQLKDKELIESLPRYPPPASTFQEMVDQGLYDIVGTTAAERKAGVWHSHHLLHLPGKGLERLRGSLLASAIAQEKGITKLSVHDLMAALVWIAREISEGNDLSSGLKRCFCYAVDLRRLPGQKGSEIPQGFWGNAVTANCIMPPEMPACSSTPRESHLHNVFASAACAIRAGTDKTRADSGFWKTAMSLVGEMAEHDYWKRLSQQADFHPFKESAAMFTAWRSGSVDKADFGHGVPWIVG